MDHILDNSDLFTQQIKYSKDFTHAEKSIIKKKHPQLTNQPASIEAAQVNIALKQASPSITKPLRHECPK